MLLSSRTIYSRYCKCVYENLWSVLFLKLKVLLRPFYTFNVFYLYNKYLRLACIIVQKKKYLKVDARGPSGDMYIEHPVRTTYHPVGSFSSTPN